MHLPGAAHLERWARDIPALAYELAEAFWPGPLTLSSSSARREPDAVTGGQDTVGLRVPGHPVALELLREFAAAGGSGGIAAPSANQLRPHQPDHRHACAARNSATPSNSFSTAARAPSASNRRSSTFLPGRPCCCSRVISRRQPSRQSAAWRRRTGRRRAARVGNAGGALCAADADAHDRWRCAGGIRRRRAARRSSLRRHSPQAQAVRSNHQRRHGSNWPTSRSAMPTISTPRCVTSTTPASTLIVVEALPETPIWAAVADRLRRAVVGAGAAGWPLGANSRSTWPRR